MFWIYPCLCSYSLFVLFHSPSFLSWYLSRVGSKRRGDSKGAKPPQRAEQGPSFPLPPGPNNKACFLSRGTLTYSYLSHSEQAVFQSYEYVDCRGNMSGAHLLDSHPP